MFTSIPRSKKDLLVNCSCAFHHFCFCHVRSLVFFLNLCAYLLLLRHCLGMPLVDSHRRSQKQWFLAIFHTLVFSELFCLFIYLVVLRSSQDLCMPGQHSALSYPLFNLSHACLSKSSLWLQWWICVVCPGCFPLSQVWLEVVATPIAMGRSAAHWCTLVPREWGSYSQAGSLRF